MIIFNSVIDKVWYLSFGENTINDQQNVSIWGNQNDQILFEIEMKIEDPILSLDREAWLG
jgi:hypothetical protein